MLDYERKRRKRRLLYSWPVIIFCLFILIVLVRANLKMYSNYKISHERKEQAENQIQELNERKLEIQSDIKRLDSRVGIEEELRSRKNLAKADEKVLILLEDKDANNKSEGDNSRQGFWEKIKSLFQ